MGGLLGRDNPLGSAFELINKRIEEEAIYRAKPYWKAAKSIEILTVETKKYIEKTQETIK